MFLGLAKIKEVTTGIMKTISIRSRVTTRDIYLSKEILSHDNMRPRATRESSKRRIVGVYNERAPGCFVSSQNRR